MRITFSNTPWRRGEIDEAIQMNATNEDTIKAYDNGARAYFDLSPQKVSTPVKKWLDNALKELPKEAKIYEIGTGTGKDADYIESLGYKMQLSDASSGFVTFLNQRNRNAKLFNVLTNQFDMQYDLILADAVLLHFTEDEIQQVLKKVANALTENGRFAFSVKKGDGDFTEDKKLGSVRYFHLWQPNQLVNKLGKAGLSVTYQAIAEDRRVNKPAWIFMVAEKMRIL